ncbi:MAG: L-lactate permease [Acidobacteriota bacterium]
MAWTQNYDPFQSWPLSTVVAGVPILVLLGSLALLRVRAHWASISGLVAALLVATLGFGMPVGMAARAALMGAGYGLLPIGWIILNVVFLYNLTDQRGLFGVLRDSLTRVTCDSRLQLLLVAFCFGAFFEGAAGFGTPVAVTAANLIGLGFPPLAASGFSLLANTAPVAFGALGTPIIALAGITGLPISELSAMVGRQLPFFSLLVPFWLIWAYAGVKGLSGIWPAVLVAGAAFAIPQLLVSNLHGPWLVDVIASLISMGALVGFLRMWRPKEIWGVDGKPADRSAPRTPVHSRRAVLKAWLPWIILSVVVFIWGLPIVKAFLDHVSAVRLRVPGLDQMVLRTPPVVTHSTPEDAVYTLNWLSATGTGLLVAALISAFLIGYRPIEIARTYWATIKRVRYSLLTVACMLALGYVSRYTGLDATLGLAFSRTGVLYPFFGTLLGWLGVALTGSDTSSNVLFGGLQKISATQLGLSPTLMAAANSSGGVMGKMIDAQSIVVASTATKWYGHEGDILKFVFLHSLALAALVGLLVFLQAYVPPFTWMVIRP